MKTTFQNAIPFAGMLPFFSFPLQTEPQLPEFSWWGALLIFFAVLVVVAAALIWNTHEEHGITVHEDIEAEIAQEETPTEHA